MRVCGVIAEYDPFHKGHGYHLRQAREASRADYMVCVLGGAFSQRGEPMLFETFDRARMALESGFDLALGMPFCFSCAQANRFAAGGVGVLAQLGVVTHLSFGCEPEGLPWLAETAGLLNRPDAAFLQDLRQGLDGGLPFARAQGLAVERRIPGYPAGLMAAPNFILGVSYLRELLRRDGGIEALPVGRTTDYRSLAPGPVASAGAVRALILEGRANDALDACPEGSRSVVAEAINEGRLHRPGALDRALLARLLDDPRPALRQSPEVSEGLEERIRRLSRRADSRKALIELVKTRRYPYARISRALSHLLVGAEHFPEAPAYARLLGFRRRAAPLLAAIAKGRFPLVSRPARSGFPGVREDLRAEELWAIGSGLPAAAAWEKQVVLMDGRKDGHIDA